MTQLNRIHALPIQLANQIAAGEVIERPASIVKELVENSIDANADQIEIQIAEAGSQLIRVTDNGNGIHQDDLILALTRHATSKLISSEQLSQIGSLGFRGEALPSITSVSHFKLISRQQKSDYAWQVTGTNDTPVPASHPIGTTVEVRDLFFNLPARRRFLRSNKTEQQHIITTIQRLALSRFDVGFNCQFSNQNQLKLPPINDHKKANQRIARICGKAFIEHAVHINQVYDDIVLSGWLGTPEANRAQTDVQYFFINGRVIRDRIINHAIRQAYGVLIPDGRQPAYVLYLTLPLDRVDVNVHPTKHEVRFRDARLVHGLINRAVEEALQVTSSSQQATTHTITVPSRHEKNVSEPSQTYSKSSQEQATSQPVRTLFETIDDNRRNTKVRYLLQQRFAIVSKENDDWLIDLTQADQQQRLQEFEQAINAREVKSRPVLVPIRIAIDAEQHATLNKNSTLLTQLGFELPVESGHIQIKAIPSLLGSADITTLINTLLTTLNNGYTNLGGLVQSLLQTMPAIDCFTHEQAVGLIQLIAPDINVDSRYCRKLDQQTLCSLFSD